MSGLTGDARSLLLEIARCPAIAAARRGGHPCTTIVQFQDDEGMSPWQLPTPWVGHMATAPILFVGSNPNISGSEEYPDDTWTDDDIVDHFDRAFDGRVREWIRDGTKVLQRDGTYSPSIRTWAGIRGRAEELLERRPEPGVDYALTELVHCRSWSERGVAEARDHCAGRYLERLLTVAAAHVIVVLGTQARGFMSDRYGGPGTWGTYGPAELAGRNRMVAYLPHPNARMERTFGSVVAPRDLRRLKDFLRS